MMQTTTEQMQNKKKIQKVYMNKVEQKVLLLLPL